MIFPYGDFTKFQPIKLIETKDFPCKGNALISLIAETKKPAKEFIDRETIYKRIRGFLQITLEKDL